ncbi:MAG: hypothetical protein M1818_006313 [Claussenomyces sp. TS43310]|nr:MAG: hypothetical protein M1818_006313 [Claussenomyces sp. TS43310]
MLALSIPRASARSLLRSSRRAVSTLSSNKHIYVFPNAKAPGSHILSLLPSNPPSPQLALGAATSIPPTPDSFSENPQFLEILQSVLKEQARNDPEVQAQAQAFVSIAGSALGSGGAFFPQRKRRHQSGGGGAGGDGAGGASAQGGAGGGGQGGWVHVSDSRNPPDYGRIAWPEDIFGSLYVSSEGIFEGNTGEYQASGTYRIVTREGMYVTTPLLVASAAIILTTVSLQTRPE